MFLFKDYQISDCKVKNLLIALGEKVINNYPLIILEYNQQLSGELKELITKLINNLQICSQLESRITNLQSALINESSSERIGYYQDSLNCKNQKLEQLNLDNCRLLILIGNRFFEKRLLNDSHEFNNIYVRLEALLEQGSCLRLNNFSYLGRVANQQGV
ncbi:hypothetical protein [Fuchsiella alkaliacetigena]|uniref:hypothetical protein n=1 Tax=Fuchsiella alkaliacetigena TaxID=957042 RepID=UPI00200AB22E|nr:hypothetical protein [Fuchsiella alkaliacetigena]MCK8823872.1 hypothetical protein [Fuchsiella alkaliacetigena]